MKRTLIALALIASAGASFAFQSTNGVVNGVFQGQFGLANTQRMDVAGINSANANVVTNVVANQLTQFQAGAGNSQLMQVGTVLPSAPALGALRTDVTVTGTVLQLQAGAANSQRARIGVIY